MTREEALELFKAAKRQMRCECALPPVDPVDLGQKFLELASRYRHARQTKEQHSQEEGKPG